MSLKGFADAMRVSLEKESLFEKSQQTGLAYIMSIDADRLLAPSFEVHNITPPNNAVRYGGWERKGANNWADLSNETFTLAGHSLGHFMSAVAGFYSATGNKELLGKLNYVVEKLDYIQTVTGSGYIGGINEETFTKLFSGDENWSDGYWVPWYGIHKIYQGLIDVYCYTGNTTALSVVTKFCDWAVDGTGNLIDVQMQEMLDVEYGGMNEVFAYMYEITGEEKYLKTARRFTHDKILDPLIDNKDELAGLHANTQIPKILGAAKIYEQDSKTYEDYRVACERFWSFVVNERSYAIGGNSIGEHFEANGAETLGVKTCESCNTYNMMRLTEYLFRWKHDSKYMDFYEDALYNHILGQQEPNTGEKMYFISLLQGHHKIYEVKDESWWCCTGTGMENPGRYTRCAYYEDGDNLYVNLYMPATYSWKHKGLAFKVETNYPYSENVKITVLSGCADAAINFRAPSWLESDMTVFAGDNTYRSGGGEYLRINSNWNAGDVINVTIPMKVRTYYSRQNGQIAYKYGPVTLAQKLAAVHTMPNAVEYVLNETKLDSVTVDVPYIITNDISPEKLVTEIDRSRLRFKIAGVNSSDGNDIELMPFYSIHHHFHNVYWDIDKAENEYEKALNKITLDRVEPDGQQDELGHLIVSQNSNQGSFVVGKIHYYRDAYGSGDAYFQYTMAVDGDNQNYLFVRYWGDDTSFAEDSKTYVRDFNIYIDGSLLSTQTLDAENNGDVYDVFYKIPQEYTNGKTNVAVKFAAQDVVSCVGKYLEMRITKDTI